MLDADCRALCIRHLAAIVLVALGLLVGSASAQSPLHELFERLQGQAEASEAPQSPALSGPFADDPEPDAQRGTFQRARSVAQPANETLITPRVEGMLPLAGSGGAGDVQMSQSAGGNISLVVRDASLSKVLALLAQTQGLNIVAANDIDALISITLRDVPLEEALNAILSVANYTWVERNGIILVTSLTDSSLPPDVQGRQIQVFDLDYAAATVVAEAVTRFLSPIGNVSTSTSDPADSRRSREMVIVEDLPESLARIAAYIHQIDRPPRQVLIEAHILQVTLTDETRCGVDFHALCRMAGSDVNIFSLPSVSAATVGGGLEVPNPTAPAFVATFASHDLQAVIDALQTTTDSKTLGSPKLLVLNGQEAHIQVGETIYYSQTTTTETTSQQGAASVETGVILRVTPRITQEGCVLLHVEPQVSSPTGERPSVDLPPNIARIELQSDVMLRNGEGMIIGGLIDERDVTNQQKVPYLGDVKGIGWAFRHTTVNKERTEIIFALVPRIQPYDAEWQAFEQGELVKAGVPLYQGPLCRTDRPWDPILPDGKRVYRPLIPRHVGHGRGQIYGPNSDYIIPTYPLPQQRFCDPSFGPAPMPRMGPLLSDEALPTPAYEGVTEGGVEIVTDQ
jgi:type II secretory pathway component GspD/PulD (secretin)